MAGLSTATGRSEVTRFEPVRRALEGAGRAAVYLFWTGCLLGAVLLFAIQALTMPLSLRHGEPGVLVEIPEGATSREIGRILASGGVIRSALLFQWWSRLEGTDASLKAGHYRLDPSMPLPAVLDQLAAGRVAVARTYIPEGFNLREIAARLASAGIADEQRFLSLASDERLVYGSSSPLVEAFGSRPIPSLEGYLFPDTYDLPVRDEALAIRTLVARFLQVAEEMHLAERARAVGMTVHQVVTLASIVEEEAVRDEERPLIAAVFLNRLARDMPLQADPTVKYVMPTPRSRLYYPDLRIDSPYNTYRYRGLPPGPIASPGRASLEAVLQPAVVDYLYFVADRRGGHVFSRTFTQHVRARRELGY
ncbi:aminodeoxychorismate lyase [Limnochorda pilosa]|uniref:Endolytic murein transglycosylase n=1 Tax=Limnochorda pilosa TaxID=1555112 RepID=A0A0K2SMV4_LIMPI|nr:aminodeoxychorismate lyase [Limnochorda pilosa]